MAITSHLGITLLEQSQAQKEITINEAFARIDAVLNSGAIDRDLATPPLSPAQGDVYIVAASPTDAWAGNALNLAYFDQVWRFITPQEGLMIWLNDENAHVVFNGSTWQVVNSMSGASSLAATMIEGRLTASAGVAVPSSDVTAATVIYFTPFCGNRIALYNGSAWEVLSFAELALSVPATTNTLYDVWAYNNAGTVTLETTAWTNDTTRATALALQNGVYVRSGALTRRYLGTFRTTSVAGRTEDSRARRYVWNYYHRVQRLMSAIETTTTWNYSATVWRQTNASTANQLDFVQGVAEDVVSATTAVPVSNSTATPRIAYTGIGLDSTTNPTGRYASVLATNAGLQNMQALYDDVPTPGRHFLTWLEQGAGVDIQTWAGISRFGITGRMMG